MQVGQSVEIAFNPPTLDPRVPLQAQYPGKGDYQTKPTRGTVIGLLEAGNCMVEVELHAESDRGDGKKRVIKSFRKRVVHESKLKAV